MSNGKVLNNIFPISSTVSAVPCGATSCVPAAIADFNNRGLIQPAAFAALNSLRTEIDTALAGVQSSTITTIETSVIILAINIYIPIFLIIILIIWILYAVGILSGLAAIVLTIILIIVAVIFIFLLRASLSSYLNQQLTAIRDAFSGYFASESFISALNQAACVYIAALPTVTSLNVRSKTNCKSYETKNNATLQTTTEENITGENITEDENFLANKSDTYTDSYGHWIPTEFM